MDTLSSPQSGSSPATTGELPFGSGFFRELLDNLYDGIYLVDAQRRILYWNGGAERLSGYPAAEMVGRFCHGDVLDHTDEQGRKLCQGQCPLQHAIETRQSAKTRTYLRHRDGRRIAVDVYTMPVLDDDGEVVGGVEVFRDASNVVALESAYQRLRELAQKDPLTGIDNRRSLDTTVERQLHLLSRTGIAFSIVLADIDHFKRVNDRWGHAAGDTVLVYVAERLEQCTRITDIVGRFGGEEFMLVLAGTRLDEAAVVAQRLCEALPECPREELDGERITASFGVAEAALGETDQSLLARADEALYRAKRLGRNRVETASPAGQPSP